MANAVDINNLSFEYEEGHKLKNYLKNMIKIMYLKILAVILKIILFMVWWELMVLVRVRLRN